MSPGWRTTLGFRSSRKSTFLRGADMPLAGHTEMPVRPEEIEYCSKLIRQKARRLSRRIEFTDSDCGDIEHELLLDVLQRFAAFDPTRAKATTFIARIVEHGVASLLRNRRAAKRNARRVVRVTHDSDHFLDQFDEIAPRRRRGIASCAPSLGSDLCVDLSSAIAGLPQDLQYVCHLLLLARPLSVIARETGRSRAALRKDVKRIASFFENAGLRAYLE